MFLTLHPLIPPSLALIAGIFLARFLEPPWQPLLALALGIIAWQAWRGLRAKGFLAWALALGFFFLGAGLGAQAQSRVPPPDHLIHLATCQMQTFTGDLVRAPEPTWLGRRLTLAAHTVNHKPVRGLLSLGLGPQFPVPRVGQRIRARLKLRPVSNFANPGGFDYAAYMARQGIRVTARTGKSSGFEVLGPGKVFWPRRVLESIRQDLGGLLDQLAPGQSRELLRALILGQRGGLKSGLRAAFGGVGVAHLLAISGLHIGMVWGLAFLFFRFVLAAWPGLALRLPVPKLAALLALIPCAAYAALAGASTPTMRALIMALCLVAALWFDRPYRASGGLALAALCIGLIWPQAPHTLSFLLSFTAVAVILLAAGPLAARFSAMSPWGKVFGPVAGSVVITACVALALWPLTVQSFHQLPLLAIPANLLLTPLVTLGALPLGLLGAALALAWPWAGLDLLELAKIPAGAAVSLAYWASALPGGVRYVAGFGPWFALVFYAGALVFLPRRGGIRRLAGAAWLAGLLFIAYAQGPAPAAGGLTVWVLDVGQGSAAVARLPSGQILVLDGGSRWASGFDQGQRVVAPFLWAHGFGRVHALAASHGDLDHVGGLKFLARWFDPQEIWTNGDPSPGELDELRSLAAKRGVNLLGPRDLSKKTQLGGARLRVLWPRGPGRPGTSSNNRSLWIGLGLGNAWVWFPGDAGPRVEREVVDHLPLSGEHVLIAPHHGGKGSCTQELLARLRPKAVIFSAGVCNPFAMPRPKTLARVRASGAETITTQSRGCVQLFTRGKYWRPSYHLSPPSAQRSRPVLDFPPRAAAFAPEGSKFRALSAAGQAP